MNDRIGGGPRKDARRHEVVVVDDTSDLAKVGDERRMDSSSHTWNEGKDEGWEEEANDTCARGAVRSTDRRSEHVQMEHVVDVHQTTHHAGNRRLRRVGVVHGSR